MLGHVRVPLAQYNVQNRNFFTSAVYPYQTEKRKNRYCWLQSCRERKERVGRNNKYEMISASTSETRLEGRTMFWSRLPKINLFISEANHLSWQIKILRSLKWVAMSISQWNYHWLWSSSFLNRLKMCNGACKIFDYDKLPSHVIQLENHTLKNNVFQKCQKYG